MKEIKAFVHHNRVAGIVHALRDAGYCDGTCNLSVVDDAGTLHALDTQEKDFSLELGEEVISEVKLELVCEDERADEAVRIIQENGRTGQKIAGWVCIIDVDAVYLIDEG